MPQRSYKTFQTDNACSIKYTILIIQVLETHNLNLTDKKYKQINFSVHSMLSIKTSISRNIMFIMFYKT